MKAKKREAIRAAVRTEIEMDKSRSVYNVLHIRFADGRGIDVPYLPWKPRETIDLPGRWVVEDE